MFKTIWLSNLFTLSVPDQIRSVVLSNWVRVMVFNDTFNNVSVISWQSFLLVEETRESGENHQLSTGKV
jgi:hypothetical protein